MTAHLQDLSPQARRQAEGQGALEGKRHKYGAQAVTVDGHRFPSKLEASRYAALKVLERAGDIFDLSLQPRYEIWVYGKKICTYVADFTYRDKQFNIITEDCKGVQTDVYKIKKKLFEAVFERQIVEITR